MIFFFFFSPVRVPPTPPSQNHHDRSSWRLFYSVIICRIACQQAKQNGLRSWAGNIADKTRAPNFRNPARLQSSANLGKFGCGSPRSAALPIPRDNPRITCAWLSLFGWFLLRLLLFFLPRNDAGTLRVGIKSSPKARSRGGATAAGGAEPGGAGERWDPPLPRDRER